MRRLLQEEELVHPKLCTFHKKLDTERRDISQLKELLSDKESNYRDAGRRIDELTAELEYLKTQLSKTKFHANKYEYAITAVASMVDFPCRKKEKIRLGFTAVTPPFNHNYSIMPNINISFDDLLMKSERMFDFTTGSNKSVPLIADPVETDPYISNNSEVCVDSLNDIGLWGKNEERSSWKSTEFPSSSRKSSFIPKTYFVGRFDEIKIKPNEMFRNFNSTFAKNVDVNKAHSMITKEVDLMLNTNCEPFVPTGSLEQPLQVLPLVMVIVILGHIARNCLHRPTEFFYGNNQKVTPKAKPTKPSMRTDQSSKPRMTPQKLP
ncbi:hypothetical protein R6Q57_003600 [Mikania cordata]